MSLLLTGNYNLKKSPANTSANVGTGASSSTKVTPQSYSLSTSKICDDSDNKQHDSDVSWKSATNETSVAATNEVIKNSNKAINEPHIVQSDTCLKRIKRSYKFLNLNYLISLVFMMLYMILGALLFLWLEKASDQAQKLHDYKFYIHEKQLFLKQLDQIYNNVTSEEQKSLLIEKAINYLHQQIGISISNRSEWCFTTALYYSGTVLTTIGYGDVACGTTTGRFMTVIYAIIGIPLMLITLRDLGNFLYAAIINALQLIHSILDQCHIFHCKSSKRSIQQNNNDCIPEIETGDLLIDHNSNKNNTNDNYSIISKHDIPDQFNNESMNENSENMNHDDMLMNDQNSSPRIPVLLALGITFGWIFLCAGLFKIWEQDWTFAESIYFTFISLSTIGLGDVSVRRRDLMTMCFVFVIIGLAMVSMCINVIQKALEDFYIKVFLKLFLEYQSNLDHGNNSVEASMNMLQMWDNNKKAQYLMSFLSKDKRATIMTKVQKDAKANGVEIPPIFTDINEETNMPNLFTINELHEKTIEDTVEEVIQQQQSEAALSKKNNKEQQKSLLKLVDTAIVTDLTINEMIEKAVQCLYPLLNHNITQTEIIESRDNESITIMPESIANVAQTVEIELTEQEIQTDLQNVLKNTIEKDDNECIQKLSVKMTETETQTDPEILQLSPTISEVRNRLFDERRASIPNQLSRSMNSAEERKLSNEDNEDEGSRTLDWNPVDGMHALKQRPVRDLTRFFESRRQKILKRTPSQL